MDVINMVMNLVVPPMAFFGLFLLLPCVYFLRLCRYFLSSLFPEDMRDKVVLITGASSGVGEQMAYQYARRGACLALVARREDRLKAVAERAKELGSPDALVPANIMKQDECRKLIETTMNHFGRLNHLVTNAAILSIFLFENAADPTKFAPVMDTNFWGSVYPTFFALPHLKKSRGRIIVTSSITSYLPSARLSYYNASKAALKHLYETLRFELSGEVGITVVFPGLTATEMTQRKILSEAGEMTIDPEMRDVEMALVPPNFAENAAKDAVRVAYRGKRYVITPYWYRSFLMVWLAAPELYEWMSRLLYFTRPGGSSDREALSKKLFTATGLKRRFYLASMRQRPPPLVKVKKRSDEKSDGLSYMVCDHHVVYSSSVICM